MSQCSETVTYPAVFLPGINFHVSAVIWIFHQAVVLKEQPGALSQTFALVVMILLDEFLHQLEQTLRVCSIPLDEVLRKTPGKSHETRDINMRYPQSRSVLCFLLELLSQVTNVKICTLYTVQHVGNLGAR